MNELEELDNERREELVVGRRVVRECESDRSDDSSPRLWRVGRQSSLELREVFRRVCDGELSETVGGDVAGSLLLSLTVLEEGSPEGVGDRSEYRGLTVDDDLKGVRA